MSAVFILDVSSAMSKQLGTTTKLEAAENSIIRSMALLPGIPTSLRLVAAGCDEKYQAPTVDFAANNTARFTEVFENLRASESSSYLAAVDSATNDFTTRKRIEESAQKLLVVFVADRKDS